MKLSLALVILALIGLGYCRPVQVNEAEIEGFCSFFKKAKKVGKCALRDVLNQDGGMEAVEAQGFRSFLGSVVKCLPGSYESLSNEQIEAVMQEIAEEQGFLSSTLKEIAKKELGKAADRFTDLLDQSIIDSLTTWASDKEAEQQSSIMPSVRDLIRTLNRPVGIRKEDASVEQLHLPAPFYPESEAKEQSLTDEQIEAVMQETAKEQDFFSKVKKELTKLASKVAKKYSKYISDQYLPQDQQANAVEQGFVGDVVKDVVSHNINRFVNRLIPQEELATAVEQEDLEDQDLDALIESLGSEQILSSLLSVVGGLG